MTKAMKQQMAEGQRMISQAEFSFGFGDISRERFDSMITKGNNLILASLDGEIVATQCNHPKIVCDKEAGVYRCEQCGEVTGHFETYRTPVVPTGRVSIGNGLYAETKTRRA